MSETRDASAQIRTNVVGTGTAVDVAEYDTVSMAIVGAVAAAEGVAETSLPPLYGAGIDPDALNELFDGAQTHAEGVFSFTYCDYVVTVTSDEGVTVKTHRTA